MTFCEMHKPSGCAECPNRWVCNNSTERKRERAKADTVLSRIERTSTGAPTAEEKAHDEAAKRHFVAFCDSGQCVRERAGYKRGESWHEGICLECAFNPYTMTKPADNMVREQARTLKQPFRERRTANTANIDRA